MNQRAFLSIAVVLSFLLSGCKTNQVASNTDTDERIDWIYHVDSLLMPFWMSDDAWGDPPGNFPAYRYPDGSPVNPDNLDYEMLVPEFQQFYMRNTDSLRRDFIRVKSRQIYGYCIAFHLTGNEKYLLNARLGLDYLIDNGAYKDSSIVTFWDSDGDAQPDIYQRNTQDLAYGLLGPAAYYYLTRDPEILDIILRINRFVWKEYFEKSTLKENTKILAWVREDFETDSTGFKELVGSLDHLNAYMLLMARIVPDSLRDEFETRSAILANSIRDNFYSEKYHMFWGSLDKRDFGGHTDFAHSIKTFWMINVTAKLTRDNALEDFSRTGAEKLLETAFLEETGNWASKYMNASLELNRNTMAWEHAELDQMAATLSFEDTAFYSRYLIHTYPYFEKYMIDPDNKGTYWGRSDDGQVTEVGFRSGWHMANFHDLEHALIGYLSTANYYGDDISLYFALHKNIRIREIALKPYHYNAEVVESTTSAFRDPTCSNLVRTRVTFQNIY